MNKAPWDEYKNIHKCITKYMYTNYSKNKNIVYTDIYSFNSSMIKELEKGYDVIQDENVDMEYCKKTNNLIIFYPLYNYTDNGLSQLYITTPFVKLKTKSYIDRHVDVLDNPTLFNLVEDIKRYTRTQVSNIVGSDFELCTEYSTNNNKFHFYTDTDRNITSEIVSYNISPKFAKYVEYNLITTYKLKQILFGKHTKEVRLIIQPTVWIKGKAYGVKMKIVKMEIKFEGASIRSKLDSVRDIVVEEIII